MKITLVYEMTFQRKGSFKRPSTTSIFHPIMHLWLVSELRIIIIQGTWWAQKQCSFLCYQIRWQMFCRDFGLSGNNLTPSFRDCGVSFWKQLKCFSLSRILSCGNFRFLLRHLAKHLAKIAPTGKTLIFWPENICDQSPISPLRFHCFSHFVGILVTQKCSFCQEKTLSGL